MPIPRGQENNPVDTSNRVSRCFYSAVKREIFMVFQNCSFPHLPLLPQQNVRCKETRKVLTNFLPTRFSIAQWSRSLVSMQEVTDTGSRPDFAILKGCSAPLFHGLHIGSNCQTANEQALPVGIAHEQHVIPCTLAYAARGA